MVLFRIAARVAGKTVGRLENFVRATNLRLVGAANGIWAIKGGEKVVAAAKFDVAPYHAAQSVTNVAGLNGSKVTRYTTSFARRADGTCPTLVESVSNRGYHQAVLMDGKNVTRAFGEEAKKLVNSVFAHNNSWSHGRLKTASTPSGFVS